MLQIKHLSKAYGHRPVFQDLSLTFPAQGLICLTGPSGSGKSTLFNLLAGFDLAYTGEVLWGTRDLKQFTEAELCCYRAERIGFVFQRYHLLAGLTVLENVLLADSCMRYEQASREAEAYALLARVGLAAYAHQRVDHLSGGQKQRVAIARALMGDPAIILADEPTGALDWETARSIMELLQSLAHERLVIMITHDQQLTEFATATLQLGADASHLGSESAAVPSEPLCLPQRRPSRLLPYVRKSLKRARQRYRLIVSAFAVGVCACLLAIGFGNVTHEAIQQFQNEHTLVHNGSITGAIDTTLLAQLQADERLEHVYPQYRLQAVTLTFEQAQVELAEKLPLPKVHEQLSYGHMPRFGAGELALTPSLAKQLNPNFKELIGQTIQVAHADETYAVTVSGIYNAGYDDFLISGDLEQTLYTHEAPQPLFALTYDVKSFRDIVTVAEALSAQAGLIVTSAAEEVAALEATFHALTQLFWFVAIVILLGSVSICFVIMGKVQQQRGREFGLLASIGLTKREIRTIIVLEQCLLASYASGLQVLLLLVSCTIGQQLGYAFSVTVPQLLGASILSFGSMISIGLLTSARVRRLAPATALRA